MVEIPKPINQMSKKELDNFTDKVLDLLLGKENQETEDKT